MRVVVVVWEQRKPREKRSVKSGKKNQKNKIKSEIHFAPVQAIKDTPILFVSTLPPGRRPRSVVEGRLQEVGEPRDDGAKAGQSWSK